MNRAVGEDDRRDWRRLPTAVIVAVAVQLPLFGFFESQTHGSERASACDPLIGSYLDSRTSPLLSDVLSPGYAHRCRADRRRILKGVAIRVERQKEKEEEPPDFPLPDDAQIVEVPEQEEPDKVEPADTKYVSNRNTRTKKETRSRKVARSTQKAPGSVSVAEPSPVQSKDSQSPDPTVTSKTEQEVQLADAATKLPDADQGRQKPKSVVQRGSETKILLPSTSSKAAIANLQALSGEFSSTDYLPDLDRGQSTVLNANRYKHADFFLRVKRAVEKHWRPAQVYRRRDPTGRAYGVKDRYTLLRVTLDDEGRVQRLLTTRNSGLEFMDEEAKAAFQRAQPFPNPPDGLLGAKNEVVFEFGFYFEITGGKHRFSWRRL